MISIEAALVSDLPDIIDLAHATWNATYRTIISEEQIQFMLKAFYSKDVIEEQMNKEGHFFFCAKEDGVLLGYSHSYREKNYLKLSKLYVQVDGQKKGIGALLLSNVEKLAKEVQCDAVVLNVNRYNPAQHFYAKMGYEIIEEVDIPLDKFFLNDYVMMKRL